MDSNLAGALVFLALALLVHLLEGRYTLHWAWFCAAAGAVVWLHVVCTARLRRGTAPILFVAVVVLAGCLLAYSVRPWPRAFGRQAWRDAAQAGMYSRRARMLESLRSLIAQGAIDSKETALHHLGPPDLRGDSRASRWNWCLGPERRRLIAIDDLWLVLEFDEKGKLGREYTTVL